MQHSLAHRGPDGAGLWISADRRVGFAHRRLSIIDLSVDADQPMHALDGGLVIVFNGEIYNHRELRVALERSGGRFRTNHSDTEVLLVGYLIWGLDGLLQRLNGMFAFALFDPSIQTVFIVRDHFGIKPMYVAEAHGDVLFASEAKALLGDDRIPRAVDVDNFRHYLTFRAVPAPGSLFQGIQTLGPGELLECRVDTGALRRRRWWDPMANARSAPSTLAKARNEFEELLQSAVEYQLESDVPVGLFLSGGLDSAYLLQLMTHAASDIATFTVTYPGFEQYNEDTTAKRLAQVARADYHGVELSAERFTSALEHVTYHQDEPIAAPVCTSVYFLAKAARDNGTKVILAGEGSDELMVGYRNWLRLRDLDRLTRAIPLTVRRTLARSLSSAIGRFLPWTAPHTEILRRVVDDQPVFWGGGMDFGDEAKRRLMGPAVPTGSLSTYAAVVEPIRERFLEHGDRRDTTGWMTYMDLQFRLPQLMLPRLDKMGMAFSVEGRVPYLDHRLVEFVMGLPPEWRGGSGRTGKPMLKEIAAQHLPRSLVYARKQGFQAPVKEWKDSVLGKTYIPALIRFADRSGLLDSSALADLLAKPSDRLYFGLVNLMLWYETFIEKSTDNTASRLASRSRSDQIK